MNNVETIVCRACQVEKEPEQFRVQSREKTGRDTLCNECRAMHRRLNKEYLVETNRRHAKSVGQTVSYVSIDELIEVFETYKTCPYCGLVELNDSNRTLDHIYAKSQPSGKHVSINLAACCRQCNSSKHDDHIYDFYQRKESFTEDLFRQFIKTWISRMIKRELTEQEVDLMIFELKAESEENRVNQMAVTA